MREPMKQVGPQSRRRIGSGRLLCSTSLTAVMLLALPSVVHAQSTRHWDGGTVDGGNPAADANGGTGTWNNTTTNWDTAATGGSPVAWTSGDDAVFGGSILGVKTVTLGAPITARSLTFNADNYVLTSNTLTLSGVGAGISVNGAIDATINSVLAGSSGLIKSGGGRLMLGGANTLTGGITVNAGTLHLLAGSSINGAGNILRVNNNAQLYIQTSTAFGADTAASRLLLDDGARIQLLSLANLTHDITFTNGGTVTIDGNGTWNGVAVLNGATTLRLGGSTLTVAGNLSDNGGVLSIDTAASGGAINLTGSLSHTGGLTVGNNTRLSGTNTYSGATILAKPSGGESRLTYTNAAAISPNSNVVLGDATTYGLVQFGYSAANITLGAGGGQFQFQGDGGFLAAIDIANDVILNLNGAAGLTWGAGNFIGTGNTLYIGTDAVNTQGRAITLVDDIDLGAQQRRIFAFRGSIADHGILSGALSGVGGGLQVVGTGVLELSGTNTYTGATEVQSALMLGSAGALSGGIGAAGGQSNLQINGTDIDYRHDGLIVLTALGGDFLRGVGTGADQVQWLDDGGFTAVGAARTVNLGNGAALTWGLNGFVGDGERLVFGDSLYGNAAINFQNTIDLGVQTRTIEVNDITTGLRAANLNGVISGSGGLILDGEGEVALTAANTFTGNAVLGSTAANLLNVVVSSIGNAGVASNLGAGGAIELKSHAGTLHYTGAGESTNRNWIVGTIDTGRFVLENDSAAGALLLTGNVTKDATGARNSLYLGGSFVSTDGNGDGVADNANVISGVISDTSGTLNILVDDGTWRLTGENTYSGTTTIDPSETLEVDDLADGGSASSIGDSTGIAANLVVNGTLRYIGTGDSTNRLMEISGAARIESSGAGAVQFTGAGLVERSGNNGDYNLTLGGTNTGENLFAPTLTNLGTGSDFNVQRFGITKEGAGLWALTTNNNAHANAYADNTIITGGALRVDNAGAITGGLGVTSSHGTTGSPERSSLIEFNGAVGTGGVLGLTVASGAFTRGLTLEADSFLSNGGTVGAYDDDTYAQGVRWTGSGGFAAWDGTQVVNLGGAGAGVAWNTGGFVLAGRELVFGYETANGTVDFQNGVNLNFGTRTVRTNNGTAAVDAIMSGVVSGGGAATLTKEGVGTLALTNANTYGASIINAGTLQIGNGGGTGALGSGNVTVASGATIAFDRNNSYTVANQITGVGGAGTLRQQGAGTTVLTSATNTIGDTAISAGTLQVDGTLTTTNAAMTGTSTLTVNGTVGASAGGASTFTGDAGVSTITVATTGTLRGAGNLGGGSDVLNLTGTLNTGAGTLSLGDGDDTFAFNDPGVLTGGVLGGAGADTLQVNNAAARTLTGSQVGEFETLNKTLGGTLTLTGTHGYANSVNVAAGTLQADGAVTTQAIALTGGSALTVNGTMQAAGGNPATMTGDAGVSTITVNAGGTLRATGDLGGGSDTLTLAGALNSGAGTLSLGDGDDTFVLNDPAVLTGGVAGGAGTDALQVNNAADRTLTAAQVNGFETLTKALGGILRLTGAHDFSAGTTVQAGVLALGDGTTAGSVAGNILNNAQVSFNSPGTQTYAGTVTGTGSVVKNGTGTMVLTGNNAYSGFTDVFQGALIVNGDQSGATGNTVVNAFATLGGSGVIGGNVSVPSLGRLSPGDPGNVPGTLTINGNLSLGSVANLDFDFGQANVAGGPLNDLINVGGNLTLDGRLNVTQSPGGTFGPGVYRILNYSGTLTNNGLNVASPDYFVQTSVANQVNLVNSAGLNLSFWDGDAGPRNDGVVNGGNGVWRAAGDVNWTDVSGLFAAPFANASFAIFQGAAGAVAVDNTNGAVQAVGMQFAVDGYTVQGGDLVLVDDSGQAGLQSIIRVGDGTAASPGYTATIASNLSGATQLVKTDAGTLVLSGANTYIGGTAINGGTLRISSDANLGDVAGLLSLNGGMLNTTASFTSSRAVDLAGAGAFLTDTGTTLTLSGVVSGAGALTKSGAGGLVLTSANTYAGGTTINAGTLQLGNGGASGSIAGDVVNNGMLAFNRSDISTFGGVVSGTGALNQIGSGTTILAASNSYTGGTTISAGILQLGNGGTNGGITGNVVNNAALVFNRSDEVTFAGLISGAGRVEQAGSGTTILTGANSYAGATTVSAGTLLVNGDQSAAIGATSVATGAMLGGTGIIGGDVTLAGGATLAPGQAGPGTLTINGNLALAGATTLAYDFGQSNAVGGALNDLTEVGGNLILDGTIDVTVSAGGNFGPGLYRVFSYSGLLTDNGLDLGAMPVGSTVAVQTSVAGQVNLINAAGGTFNFWDGAAPANASNNLVDGGNGTWQNSSGNNDWTTTTGVVSGPYTDGAFAIFTAASGTVSVDNSLGAVTASGLQFASDGYRITGQDLTLVGPQSLIRVGDGTAPGAGFTATIDAALVGSAQLVKADLGTLVLAGVNTYTGGTRIDAGTLRISSDANLGDMAGALTLNGGTLNTIADIGSSRAVNLLGTGALSTDAGTTLTLNGAIAGAGGFTKTGAGSLVLTGTNSFGGDVNVTAGSLFVNGDQSAATGTMSVATGATLGGSGVIGGDVTLANGATLAAGTNNVGTLTVGGSLTLSSGTALDFTFGQASVAGGALNDLVNVGGNLTLDGTINVTVPASGSFGPGIYRVFNYGGTLTNNGLALGALPGGSVVSVQTAVSGQVNLVNTAGLTLSFWDGGAGPKNSGTVDGGDGAWCAAGALNNWTDMNGSVNADYAQDSFAIFSAASGAVTVDDIDGNVRASGMQFASDGYVITGDALTLTGAQATIQVGDGSGANYTATIDAELAGAARVVKTDVGTLVLTGANSYTGGTAINGGTLRISAEANLGDAAGGLSLNGGTLNTTATFSSSRAVDLAGAGTFLTDTGTMFILGGAVSGAGALTKNGAGALVLTNANTYTGGTAIAAGTLQLGDGGASGSITGDVANSGTLAFNRSDSLTFAGAITGTGTVNQIGSGTTILTANSSYAGGTAISAGVLQLGAGGTTGGITGDVANNAALVFNRSDVVTFAGLISGTGRVEQASSGAMILTGANSYAGTTTVSAGALLVNGNQSAATGLTGVASGATLGGTGIIGGSVTVADGATLAPGAGGAGTLAINGSLAFAGGSLLAFDFGAANAPGNPLNDVVNVGGNLTLDGTINVAVTPGGAFDIGLYRVINYAGTLTDNGLAIGTLPAGADAFVQTAVANQVNLINVGGATLNFWDGGAGPKFNGAVEGGSGTWQNSSGNNNWADATGAVNAGYDDGAFAIFTGTAGTVTIDNSLGAVTASGLQFAVTGYSIAGGDLTLTGPQPTIRVGDGTAAGAGYTATIDSAITGSTQLVKTDAGTLVLSRTNTYTGGTAINGGTVRISSDANLGAAAGALSLNGGTLNTTADLSSGRTLNLVGAGALFTDAGTTLTLTGASSGAGALTKNGGGTLVLGGTGAHTGTTTVGTGTLLVNGNYAGATGATTVASGASLGGTGTIGGNVALADGATLTPGVGGAGTLTVNGDLLLATGTTLAYEFGQANVAGGALNDLVNVGGDLVLDGTINVSVPTGGAFDVGVYRVFNYGGTLTNNGLTLGALPAGSDVDVQTSIAGQVNLVNSAGLTLNFWDGTGPKNNGVINGGAGTWQASTGNDNWTNANGTVNAAYADGAFAVFGGTGGTVTVDNNLGQVTASGLQFAANGYTITGDAIALTGPQSTIRVGDGSAAGSGFVATLNSVLGGAAQLVKTDAGTLILGGTNTYTGGTLITAGTVQISADANLGAAAGDVTLDGGTLATSASIASARDIVMASGGTISTASGTTFTFNGQLSGTGALAKAGAGTLLLTGDNSGFAGSTQVDGTLTVNGSLCGNVNVTATGRLQGTGTVCTTVNAGTVATGNSIGTLTVAGDYTGNAGMLEVEAELGGDSSPADRLVVTGSTFGTTEVVVINQGGLGAATVEGIKIVDVGGASNGLFTLKGDYVFEGDQAVIAGAYGYRLYKNGVATPGDGDWYLRSSLLDAPGQPNDPQAPLYQPGVPLYESYGATLQTLSRLPTLQERVGNRQWSGFSRSGVGMWSRIEASRYRPEVVVSTSGADLDANAWALQAGFDVALRDNSAGTLIAGINGRYGKADAQVRSRFGNGEINADGYDLGATLTWYGRGGFYADAQAQLSWYNSDLESGVLGSLVKDNDGTGEAFSLELGKRIPLGGGFSITPQAQIAYSSVRFDMFADPNGAVISTEEADSLRGRLGVSLDHQRSWGEGDGARQSHFYGIANLSYEWLDGSTADVSGALIGRRDERLWGELGLGGSYSWNGGRTTVFSEITANTALNNFGDSKMVRATAGVRMRF